MGEDRVLEREAASISKGMPRLENVLIKPVLQKLCVSIPSQTASSKMNCMWSFQHRKVARESHTALLALVDSLVLNQFQGARQLDLYTGSKRKTSFKRCKSVHQVTISRMRSEG